MDCCSRRPLVELVAVVAQQVMRGSVWHELKLQLAAAGSGVMDLVADVSHEANDAPP